MKPSVAIATLVLGLGRGLGRLVPRPLLRRVEGRVFGAVFHLTRVTNDAYGWRPDAPGGTGQARGGDDALR